MAPPIHEPKFIYSPASVMPEGILLPRCAAYSNIITAFGIFVNTIIETQSPLFDEFLTLFFDCFFE